MRLLDENKILGIKRYFHYHGDGKFTIQTVQSVGHILEANKREFNDGTRRFGNQWMTRVGRVPLSLAMKYWLTRDDSEIRKFLNDPVNAAWKTKPVRL